MSAPTLSVVIPAFNEEQGIQAIAERVLSIREALLERGYDLELVVVDDGSHDATPKIAAQIPKVRVIRHLTNRGYGAALKTGFRHARGEILAFLDADGTYPPEALPEMCTALEANGADIVVGSRMSGAASAMPTSRKIGNFAFASLLSGISHVRVRDTSSGMRVFRRSILPRLYPLPDGLDFTPAMTTRAVHEDLVIYEYPIAYSERIGRSKLSVVRDGVRFTNTIVWTTMTYNPVRILGGIGLFLLSISALLALILALGWLGAWQGQMQLAPLLAFLVLVSSVTGASFFCLGIVFSYLIALFTQKPIRRGMFGRVLFDPPLDYAFGKLGIAAIVVGSVVGALSLVLGIQGWQVADLWILFLVSGLLILIGVQLLVTWIVLRVLEELAVRESSARRDLSETAAGVELLGEQEITSQTA